MSIEKKPDFFSAALKLDRASEHVQELKLRIDTFLQSDFYTLTSKVNEGTGEIKVNFQQTCEMSQSVNAVIGDAIGNFRSSLDYLIVAINDIAPTDKKVEVRKIGFPFADDGPGFAGELKAERQSCLPQFILDILSTKTQAYKGGHGEVLWTLNKLRNIDKHRILITTANISGIRLSFKIGRINVIDQWAGMPIGYNCEVVRVSAQNFEITKQPIPTCEIVFQEANVIYNVKVIDFLQCVSSQTRSILESFKKAFDMA